MTRTTLRTREPPAQAETGASVYPSATAMVWPGPGRAHDAIAVPGVRLAPADALVSVELATACESEVQAVSAGRSAAAPRVLGHEQVGRVVALAARPPRAVDGTAVAIGDRRSAIGDRVVWSVAIGCGRCVRCRRRAAHACARARRYGNEHLRRGWELAGGFATHVHLLAGTAIVRVPESVPAAVLAPASCATSMAVAAVEAAEHLVSPHAALAVVAGGGLRGLSASALPNEAGARVVFSDADARIRALAGSFGAAAVADSNGGAGALRLLRSAIVQAGGRTAICRIALDFTGDSAVAETLLNTVDDGGVVVLAGAVLDDRAVALDPRRLLKRSVTIRGVRGYAPDQLQRAVEFLSEAASRYPFSACVADVLPLAQADAALELAASASNTRVGLASRSWPYS